MVKERSREQRLRNTAERQGLRLVKSRRRDPRALDFGRYWLQDPWNNNVIVLGGEFGVDLDDIEKHLTGEDD